MINVSDDAKFVMSQLTRQGFEIFAVGGCVRDLLLLKIPQDYDFATNARPENIMAAFDGFDINDRGEKYGSIKINYNNNSYEITTYRVDAESNDSRHPNHVEYVETIEQDLVRRDFTINAICLSSEGVLFDPCAGINDINQRLIKCIGEPRTRFAEDSLRILRAIRFASTLDFYVDCETAKAIHDNKKLVLAIPKQRVEDEVINTLCGVGASRVVAEFCDVFNVLFPSLKLLKCRNDIGNLLNEVPKDRKNKTLLFGSLIYAVCKKQNRKSELIQTGEDFANEIGFGKKQRVGLLNRLQALNELQN